MRDGCKTVNCFFCGATIGFVFHLFITSPQHVLELLLFNVVLFNNTFCFYSNRKDIVLAISHVSDFTIASLDVRL